MGKSKASKLKDFKEGAVTNGKKETKLTDVTKQAWERGESVALAKHVPEKEKK